MTAACGVRFGSEAKESRCLFEALLDAGARLASAVAPSVDITVDDRNVDIVAAGFDAGVRLREAIEKDMVSVRFSREVRFIVVGSKE
jgi:hypothetical protein